MYYSLPIGRLACFDVGGCTAAAQCCWPRLSFSRKSGKQNRHFVGSIVDCRRRGNRAASGQSIGERRRSPRGWLQAGRETGPGKSSSVAPAVPRVRLASKHAPAAVSTWLTHARTWRTGDWRANWWVTSASVVSRSVGRSVSVLARLTSFRICCPLCVPAPVWPSYAESRRIKDVEGHDKLWLNYRLYRLLVWRRSVCRCPVASTCDQLLLTAAAAIRRWIARTAINRHQQLTVVPHSQPTVRNWKYAYRRFSALWRSLLAEITTNWSLFLYIVYLTPKYVHHYFAGKAAVQFKKPTKRLTKTLN